MTTALADPIVQFPALKDAQGKLDAKRKSLFDIFTEAGPDYDLSKVKSLIGDTHDKVVEIGKINTEIDDLKKGVDELMVVARAAAVAAEGKESGGAEPGSDKGAGLEIKDRLKRQRFGDLLVESAAVKGYSRGSAVGPMAHLDVDIKTLFQRTAGWDPEDLRTDRFVEFATRPAPRVVDFIPQTTTAMSAVKYMEETTFTNTAAETAEGGTYPESALVLTERTVPVEKVSTWLPVTDEQFEDEPRARAYVENRLPFMVRQRLDSQVLVGNGTTPNLLGTESVSGINSQALGADPIPDAIYKALRAIRETGFAEPNVVFIRPSKWEAVRLLKTADGVYIWGHPAASAPMTIWGVPVVETTAVTATKAVMGDYATYSELAVRRGLDVQVSNSHGTHFVEGKLAVRCDVRVAMITYRPSAFAVVTGL